jgi:hypothetical protein
LKAGGGKGGREGGREGGRVRRRSREGGREGGREEDVPFLTTFLEDEPLEGDAGPETCVW